MIRPFSIAVCLVALSASSVRAQVVIQQPVVGVVAANTVVNVPDGGSALIGGVSGAQDARNTPGFSLGPNRGFGSTRQNSSMQVRVKIHDLREEDEQILSQYRAGQEVSPPASLAAQRFRTLGGKKQSQTPQPDRSLSANRPR